MSTVSLSTLMPNMKSKPIECRNGLVGAGYRDLQHWSDVLICFVLGGMENKSYAMGTDRTGFRAHLSLKGVKTRDEDALNYIIEYYSKLFR